MYINKIYTLYITNTASFDILPCNIFKIYMHSDKCVI